MNEFFKPPSSICTLSTIDCAHELIGFLYSAWNWFPGIKIFIACDHNTQVFVKSLGLFDLHNICFFVCLDKFAGLGRTELEKNNLLTELASYKMKIMQKSLDYCGDTIYMDSDVIINHYFKINHAFEVGLSPEGCARVAQLVRASSS